MSAKRSITLLSPAQHTQPGAEDGPIDDLMSELAGELGFTVTTADQDLEAYISRLKGEEERLRNRLAAFDRLDQALAESLRQLRQAAAGFGRKPVPKEISDKITEKDEAHRALVLRQSHERIAYLRVVQDLAAVGIRVEQPKPSLALVSALEPAQQSATAPSRGIQLTAEQISGYMHGFVFPESFVNPPDDWRFSDPFVALRGVLAREISTFRRALEQTPPNERYFQELAVYVGRLQDFTDQIKKLLIQGFGFENVQGIRASRPGAMDTVATCVQQHPELSWIFEHPLTDEERAIQERDKQAEQASREQLQSAINRLLLEVGKITDDSVRSKLTAAVLKAQGDTIAAKFKNAAEARRNHAKVLNGTVAQGTTHPDAASVLEKAAFYESLSEQAEGYEIPVNALQLTTDDQQVLTSIEGQAGGKKKTRGLTAKEIKDKKDAKREASRALYDSKPKPNHGSGQLGHHKKSSGQQNGRQGRRK